MAEKKIATGYVGNALRSSAADHTTTFTDEVFDTERQKYQSEVNINLESKIKEEAESRELAITAEAQARTQNDQLLSQAIAAEQERAEAAEQAIIYDVSANNNGAVFESLSAILNSSDLSTLIPTSVRHGGMSIRFIQGSEQSSDNKYVQYRLMSDEFSVYGADWQVVDANAAGIVFAGGRAVITSDSSIVFDERFTTIIPAGTKMFLKINSGIGTAATAVTLAIDMTGGWRNFNSDSYFVLPRDCTRLSVSVQSGNLIGDGGLIDVSVSYASSIPEIAYLGESIESESAQRKQGIESVKDSIGETKESLTVVESNVSLPFVVNVQSTSEWYKTPYTIKAGNYVVFMTNNQTLYGKTTESASENYESLILNTAVTKDINYIRFTETGDCTVIFSGIFSGQNIDTDNIGELYTTLNIPRLFTGHISTSSVWRPHEGFHYMIRVKPYDNIAVTKMAGVSNTFYAILKSYNVQKKELVFATGCSLVSLSDTDTSKVVVPSDGNYLYVSYRNNTTNAQAGSVVINGYDVLNESVIGNLVKDRDNIKNLQGILGYEYISPDITYSTGDEKYINNIGVVTTNTNYEYSNPISVKRNDVLFVTGFGGSTYCCLALSVSSNVFTPLVNYSDVDINKEVHFFYVCKEDCFISLSSRKTYGNLVILRGIDTSVNTILANILGIPSVAGITYTESMVNPDECLDNLNLDSSSPATPKIDSNYWVTNFIPVDDDTNWLFCNYNRPTRVVCYDENKQFVHFVGSTAIPLDINAFANPTTKYVRIQFAKSLVSFDDRYKVRIVKSVRKPNNSSPCNKIDGSLVGIRNIAYVNNDDIAKFEADKIYGSYVSATVFNVNGEAVELNTAPIYIDKSTKRQYRYNGSALYDVGYYDSKSLIFTESFEVDIPKTDLSTQNLIVTVSAKYCQGSGVTDKPMIRLINFSSNNLTSGTINYVIGGDRGFKQKEWRAQVLNYQQYKTIVSITIPAGVTLFIDKFGNYYSDKKGYETFPRVNAHAFAAPDNTIMYMEQNAKLGFACMITIPKRTYDDVWVCFHDDGNITNYTRHEDGSALTDADIPQNAPDTITSISNCPIGYFTYEELMQFDFGIYNSYDRFKPNRGQKIPLLKDFFMICAKTGIHPMLSVHPNWTESEWREIKTMTDKLGLTEKLNLKFAGGEEFFGTTYPVFGDEIESYAIDVSTSRDAAESMASLIKTLGIDFSKVRVGIEYFRDVITTAKVNNAIANGMFAAMVMDGAITSEDYEYWMEHGVSEFTDDNHTSVGLNW